MCVPTPIEQYSEKGGRFISINVTISVSFCFVFECYVFPVYWRNMLKTQTRVCQTHKVSTLFLGHQKYRILTLVYSIGSYLCVLS